MAKNKTAYVCSECGADFSRWQGQCSECKEWNTITEVRLGVTTPGKSARYTGYAGAIGSQVQTLAEVATTEIPRFSSGFKELDGCSAAVWCRARRSSLVATRGLANRPCCCRPCVVWHSG